MWPNVKRSCSRRVSALEDELGGEWRAWLTLWAAPLREWETGDLGTYGPAADQLDDAVRCGDPATPLGLRAPGRLRCLRLEAMNAARPPGRDGNERWVTSPPTVSNLSVAADTTLVKSCAL
jgi:hypothetical protein